MSRASRWPDAALAGLATSMRTFAAPAVLAARGRVGGKPRVALLVAAAAELASDKVPDVPDRTDPPGLAARIGAGGWSGYTLAGPAGVAAGAAGAAVGTFATFRARKLVVQATGLPDPVVAVGEDLITFTLAALATRPDPEPSEDAPPPPSLARNLAKGVAAGVAGTAAMTLAQGVEFQLTDAKPSRSPADAAEKIKKALGRGRIKRRHKPAVNQGMHWLYGTAWGVPYGVLGGSPAVKPEISGPAFGLLVWGAALVHQPALGLADPPWKRSVESLGSEALFHVVYGIGAAAAMRRLAHR